MPSIESYIIGGDLDTFKSLHKPYKNQKTFYIHMSHAICSHRTDFMDYLLYQDFPYHIHDILRFCLLHEKFVAFQHIFNTLELLRPEGFLNHKQYERLLLMCVANQWLNMICFWEAKGYDLKINHQSALKTAVSFGHLNIIQYFMKKGFCLETKPYYRLRYHCRRNNVNVSEFLLKHIMDSAQSYKPSCIHPSCLHISCDKDRDSLIYFSRVLNQCLKICAEENYYDGAIRCIISGADKKIALRYGNHALRAYCSCLYHQHLNDTLAQKHIENKIQKI